MADTIILEVARFSPERDTEVVFQTYELPLRADWIRAHETAMIENLLELGGRFPIPVQGD